MVLDLSKRVYCAYSLPAVILLFSGPNWEKHGLKRCFLDLIGANKNEDGHAKEQQDGGTGNSGSVPLPVKRCLASSVHAVAHMLGPDVASRDSAFLGLFEGAFLRDPDEAIRLNVLRNMASFLGALPPGDGPGHRNTYLPVLSSVLMSEDVLGAAKRHSASNPGVLNWRQRDAVARVLPDLIVLYGTSLNREFLWPVLKALLTDSVSAVREDAAWSVPVLLRKYVTTTNKSNKAAGGSESREIMEIMATWIFEVTSWLNETLLETIDSADNDGRPMTKPKQRSFRRLKKEMTPSEGAFSKRQGYCRVLEAVALAMRIGEGDVQDHHSLGLESSLPPSVPIDPFEKMTPYEIDRFRSIMLDKLLPPALKMAADCVANVRLTLTKCLRVLPKDIRQESHVEAVLSALEEELTTWDVGDMPLDDANPGGILGTAAGPLSDLPEVKAISGGASAVGGIGSSGISAGVVLTSTMSAC